MKGPHTAPRHARAAGDVVFEVFPKMNRPRDRHALVQLERLRRWGRLQKPLDQGGDFGVPDGRGKGPPGGFLSPVRAHICGTFGTSIGMYMQTYVRRCPFI